MKNNDQMTLNQCKFFMSINSLLRVSQKDNNEVLRTQFLMDAVRSLKKMSNEELSELTLRRHR